MTPNRHLGIGSWSPKDIVDYLKSGTNRFAASSGPMTEAIENSTQYMTQDDLKAIARYLQSIPPSEVSKSSALGENDTTMIVRKKVSESQCEACHISNGSGIRNMIPTLAGNPQVNSPDPISLLNVVLNGSQGPSTHANPTAAGMPNFSWKLSDSNIADVMTYIRNSWNNAAAPVSSETVAKTRNALHASPWMGDAKQ